MDNITGIDLYAQAREIKNDYFRKTVTVNLKNFLSIDSVNNLKTLYIPSDSTIMLFSFGKALTKKDLEEIGRAQNRRIKRSSVGLYRNIIYTPNGPVHIFPDGTFRNTLFFSPRLSLNPLTGLNMALPVEYAGGSKP